MKVITVKIKIHPQYPMFQLDFNSSLILNLNYNDIILRKYVSYGL